MEGIDNEEIRFSVVTAGITEPATLARHLKTFDDKEKEINAFANTSKLESKGSKSNSMDSKNQKSLVMCYRCNATGYFKNKWPSKYSATKALVQYQKHYERVNFVGLDSPKNTM